MAKNYRQPTVILILCFLVLTAFLILQTQRQKPIRLTDKPVNSHKAVQVKVYFSSPDASLLVAEKRNVSFTGKGKDLYINVINAIIKGPSKSSGLVGTIPQGTKLLNVEVNNGKAIVNFSKELKENHWGGSSGETATIFSIVNTLTEFAEIKSVKIILEGKEMDSLAGHYDTTDYFGRDDSIIQK